MQVASRPFVTPSLRALPLRQTPPPGPPNQQPPPFDHGEQAARYTNNLVMHLLVSDLPSVVTTAANYTPMPKSWDKALAAMNVINVVTSGIALIADVRELRGTFKNPDALPLDKKMDVGHFIASDILGTASTFIPFFANVHGPLAGALFLGGQALIVGADLTKTAYDFHRKGQQSAHHPNPPKP